MEFSVRKARIKDAKNIYELINYYAEKDLMMPRSLGEIFENIRDFWVARPAPGKKILGCAALHVVGWNNLAEIKSLAVRKGYQGKGVGRQLIQYCLDEAGQLQAADVFALSYQPGFFKKLGFRRIAKAKLPHKVWAECCNCPKFPDCGEIALIKKIELADYKSEIRISKLETMSKFSKFK